MRKILYIFVFLICSFTNAMSMWHSIGQMSGSSDFVYAMTSNSGGDLFASSWATGIYKSTNVGVSWSFSGLSGKRVSYLTVAPNGDIYGLSITQSFSYIHRSTDNGNSWTDVYTGSFPINYAGGGAIVFPTDGSIVAAFAVTVGPLIGNVSTFVFKSTDGGNNWVQKQIIDLGFVGGMVITSDNKILLGTSLGGVVYSPNNGESFISLTTFPSIFIKTILKAPDNTIYVSDAFGLNRSTDNGQTFQNAGGQNSTAFMRAAEVNTNGDLFISTDDKKVFYSNDKGVNWTQINNGIPGTSQIYSFTSSNGSMFSGSNNAGAYIYDSVTGIETQNELADDFILHQNYPNPFNPSTIISYSLKTDNFVEIKIFDVKGSEIAALVGEKQNAGIYNIKWDAANYSSGVYIYQVLLNGKVAGTKKMQLIK
jgi:Secretion system C-terminal sorting domain